MRFKPSPSALSKLAANSSSASAQRPCDVSTCARSIGTSEPSDAVPMPAS